MESEFILCSLEKVRKFCTGKTIEVSNAPFHQDTVGKQVGAWISIGGQHDR